MQLLPLNDTFSMQQWNNSCACVPVREGWRGMMDVLKSRSPLSPLHHTSHWQAISLLDSEFRLRDHLKHFELSPLGENVTPSPLNTTFELLPSGHGAKSVQRGKLWEIIFLFSPFFSLENQKIFQQRGIQCSSFSGLTFSDWQRGRIRFKWKTLKIFRGAFSTNSVSFLCGKKKKKKKRSSQRSGQYLSTSLEGLVILWNLPWETQIEMSHYASGEFRQRVSTCWLQGQTMSSSGAVTSRL